jgi:hypothetical protein
VFHLTSLGTFGNRAVGPYDGTGCTERHYQTLRREQYRVSHVVPSGRVNRLASMIVVVVVVVVVVVLLMMMRCNIYV